MEVGQRKRKDEGLRREGEPPRADLKIQVLARPAVDVVGGERLQCRLELGHVIMHRIPTDTIEDEAYTFGAELLVPEKELRRDLIGSRLTLERLARLKARWRVSMQFLLFQAKEIGTLSDYQSQYLWKQISRLGWRTREPTDTDFAHEQPTLFPRILTLHREGMGYDVSEFAELLRLEPNDVRQLYGIQDTVKERQFLHLIK